MGPGDASVLDRVVPDVFDHPIDRRRLAVYLREPSHLLFVAICGDEVIGHIRGIVHRHPDAPDELYIDNLGVAAAFRRQGIGTQLVRALLQAGKERGCAEAWVGTEENNLPARALYESLGDSGALSVFFTYRL